MEALMEKGAIVRNLENLGERALPYKISKHKERHKRGGYVLLPFPEILAVLLLKNGTAATTLGSPWCFLGCRWELGGLTEVLCGCWGAVCAPWSVLWVLFWFRVGFQLCFRSPRPAGLPPT